MEGTKAGAIARDAEVVGVVPAQHHRQPPVLVAEPLVHPLPHLLAQLLQFADHPLPFGLLAVEKAPVSGLAAVMREARKSNTSAASCPRANGFFSKPSELDQPRLVLLEMQTELGQSPPDVPLISVNRPRILIPPCINDLKTD